MYHGGSKKKPEKWDYASLEWIHRARVDFYRTERKRALTEIAPRLSPNAAALARRLKLKRSATEFPGTVYCN